MNPQFKTVDDLRRYLERLPGDMPVKLRVDGGEGVAIRATITRMREFPSGQLLESGSDNAVHTLLFSEDAA